MCGPTYLEGPAGSMLVVVADSLQLAVPRKLSGYKLQAPPQTFTVEEHKELGHHSGEEKTGGICTLVSITIVILYSKIKGMFYSSELCSLVYWGIYSQNPIVLQNKDTSNGLKTEKKEEQGGRYKANRVRKRCCTCLPG